MRMALPSCRAGHYWSWLVAVLTCFTALALAPAHAADTDPASSQKLKRVMEQSRAGAWATPSDDAVQERAVMLARGEAALLRNDTDAAQTAFDNAASVLHAADTEMGLVRTYMQQGQYRRALAFAAHTAGSHPDDARGSALYAWLLHIGGQPVIAQKLLAENMARLPKHHLLSEVQKQLQTNAPIATGELLNTPARMAPQGPLAGLPKRASVIASGLLIDSGKQALVPTAVLGKRSQVWVRNGLGQLALAQRDPKRSDPTMTVLILRNKLADPDSLMLAPRDAFPGSPAFALEYHPSPQAHAQWPVLHMGFLGSPQANSAERPLGIALNTGPRGGPVFDEGGRLIGIAMNSIAKPQKPRKPGNEDQLVLISTLHQRLGPALGTLASAQKQRVSVDQIYESALRSTLQIIAAP
jgi:hypothetical protein